MIDVGAIMHAGSATPWAGFPKLLRREKVTWAAQPCDVRAVCSPASLTSLPPWPESFTVSRPSLPSPSYSCQAFCQSSKRATDVLTRTLLHRDLKQLLVQGSSGRAQSLTWLSLSPELMFWPLSSSFSHKLTSRELRMTQLGSLYSVCRELICVINAQ